MTERSVTTKSCGSVGSQQDCAMNVVVMCHSSKNDTRDLELRVAMQVCKV